MGGTTGQMHPSCAMLQKEKDIQRLQRQGLDGEEIARQELVLVVIEEDAPRAARPSPFWGWWYTITFQHDADGRLAHPEPQLAQLASQLFVT
jgi:hypothetical protein